MLVQKLLSSDCSVKDFQCNFNIKDTIFTAAIAWSDVKNITLHRVQRKLRLKKPKSKKKDENDDEPTTDHSEIVSAVNCVSNTELSALSVEEIDGWIDIDKNVPIKEELTGDVILQSVFSPKEAQETVSNEKKCLQLGLRLQKP